MKACVSFSLILAAASGMAVGAETAYTTPVGYVSLGDTTAGQPAVKASTDVAVSIPLNRPTEYAGAVASATATTITVEGAAWSSSQWTPDAATPYLVSIRSGTENGFLGLISSHTADTLTVTAVTSGNLATVAAGTIVQIYKAWTLISLFPAGAVPAGTRVLAYSGTVSGVNLAADLQYVWTGSIWNQLLGAPGGNANNTILYSGESFVMRASATQVTSLVVSGEVPTFNSRTDISKLTAGVAQDNRISYISPVDELIGQSSLGTGVGFTAGDRLLAFDNNAAGVNKSANEILVWTGTAWNGLLGVAGDQTNTYTLKSGKGYVFRRIASAPVGNVDWKDQQSYIPSP